MSLLSTVSLLSVVCVVGDCHPQSVNECPAVSNQLAWPLDRLQLCDGMSPLSDLRVQLYDLRSQLIRLACPKRIDRIVCMNAFCTLLLPGEGEL